ncbi:DNA polymerase I [Komagataeibacter intermedius]|uniref:DNA polymerase I n=2 Tax=Komagataeibacter intermedius TaxID=66229 RepID=A0A0N1FJU5_9PROT|nr:DNA polymerase I [Komagataeibacter intermedius]KPH86089.1 DNA polymerase [Komagataeibacter intermedius AF2]MCF3637329.1 DNA polymerase I [Komagataeibacter intermedius]GAN87967.1 DNA polymerase I [Komagataeibacter intermedius TF2]GBQ75256.1 DNA polymerase I [Komagataeibacter intermedius NRIC 0521]
MSSDKQVHLILVDGSGFIFRAFHALPPMTSPDGTPVNAVYGFSNMLSRLLREHAGTHLAVIFDAGRHTFRNDLYGEYKAHRPEPPEELRPQFSLVRDATAAFGVPALEEAGWEADDLIAAYARKVTDAGGQCTIYSSDKDLMQLIRPGVMMMDPIKNRPIGAKEVEAKFGVTPDRVAQVQALIGDPVDNVPGVPGIGPKTASALMAEYGSLDAILAGAAGMKASRRRDNLLAHADMARLSLQLVTLREDAPCPEPLSDLACCDVDMERLGAWLSDMGFSSLLQRMGLKAKPRPRISAHDTPAAQPAGGLPPIPPEPYGPYETVTDPEVLRKWVEQARTGGVCAVDTETDGLDPLTAPLVGISLAPQCGRACYIPLSHQVDLMDSLGTPQMPVKTALDILAPLFADPSVLKVFQNAKFDLLVLTQAGCAQPAPIDDTMLISYAQSAGKHGQGMDELSRLILDHTPIPYDEVTGTGRNRVVFSKVDIARATPYAAEDADVTLRLWQVLRPQLRTNHALALYEEMERPLVPILADMERAGIAVDADDLRAMSTEFAQRMGVIEAEIHTLAGRDFNVGSPKQLGEILFDEMGLPGGKRTKAGAWGTDSSVLQDLADQGHDLPARILAWRQLAKLKSTYADALLNQINPATGRVHTSFQMAVTTTGRLSSNDPNLQNIPIRTEEGGRIRRAFVAAPGYVLVSADYSQIELRLLADVADIPALREAFELGQDIHARTASEVFGIPIEGMDPLTRRRAKAINFGIIYGISAFGLGRQLGIPPGEARGYIDAYFARYPGIRDYMERVKAEARVKGYVTTPFGRRCWVPGIADKSAVRRNYAERQAINAPLQGGAADIIKRAMVRIPAALSDAGLDGRMLLQVHDELVFEVRKDDADRLAALVRQVMESAATLSVPLVVETGTGTNWADAH